MNARTLLVMEVQDARTHKGQSSVVSSTMRTLMPSTPTAN